MDFLSKRSETRDPSPEGRPARRLVAVLFGLVEFVLAFRLVFKLFGASEDNGFVKGVYSVSQPIVGLFEGIFPNSTSTGSILEPATLILLLVVTLVGLAVMKRMGRDRRRIVKTPYEQPQTPQKNGDVK